MPLPSLDVLKNFLPLLEALEVLVPSKLFVPALVLTYSGIDSAAWVSCNTPAVNRFVFMEWVRRYMLPAKPLPCTAEDLYSARCGLLHNMTSDSDMTRSGSARVLLYAWGLAPLEPLEKMASRLPEPRPIPIRGDDLIEAFSLGLVALEAELTQPSMVDAVQIIWQAQAIKKANLVLEYVPWPPPK